MLLSTRSARSVPLTPPVPLAPLAGLAALDPGPRDALGPVAAVAVVA